MYLCFRVSSAVTNQRAFFGVRASTGSPGTTFDPANGTNLIGVGWSSGDTTIRVFHNDGAGAATEIDLGANFPSNDAQYVYEFFLATDPNGSDFDYLVRRNQSPTNQATGTINSDMPANTLWLSPVAHCNNGGDASAVVTEVYKVYAEFA
jgi:hypothetical protein